MSTSNTAPSATAFSVELNRKATQDRTARLDDVRRILISEWGQAAVDLLDIRAEREDYVSVTTSAGTIYVRVIEDMGHSWLNYYRKLPRNAFTRGWAGIDDKRAAQILSARTR